MRIFQNLLTIFCLSLVVTFFFASCEKEDMYLDEEYGTETTTQNSVTNGTGQFAGSQMGDDDLEELCFDLVYPVTVIFPDDSEQAVNDLDELIVAVEAWYTANPTSDEDPTLAFPVDVILENGNQQTVQNEEELEELFEECEDEYEEEEECFELNFPVTVIFPDMSTAVANSYDELEQLEEDWEANNPGSTEEPTLEFPIEVTAENGDIITVNSEEELEELWEACEDDDDDECDDDDEYEDEECFEVNFPVTVIFPDMSTAEANSYDELEQLEEDWEANNPGSTQEPTVEFPIEVTLENGDEVTVNSEEELRNWKKSATIKNLFEL